MIKSETLLKDEKAKSLSATAPQAYCIIFIGSTTEILK
jgi:hypothetical protein